MQHPDLELWLREPVPYILIVYDAQSDVAYWLYVMRLAATRKMAVDRGAVDEAVYDNALSNLKCAVPSEA